METCEGRALEVAKAVLPSRSPPGHAHILHRFWCKMCPMRPALWAHHLQATQAGRLSRLETDYGLFACTRSVGRQKMHGRIRSVRCAFRAAKQPQQLASITFCLPQPSVAKQGVSERELQPSQLRDAPPQGFHILQNIIFLAL